MPRDKYKEVKNKMCDGMKRLCMGVVTAMTGNGGGWQRRGGECNDKRARSRALVVGVDAPEAKRGRVQSKNLGEKFVDGKQ